jgi:hypothetical protein
MYHKKRKKKRRKASGDLLWDSSLCLAPPHRALIPINSTPQALLYK